MRKAAMEALPLPRTVNGLPFHPLIVHAVVVLLPLAAVGAIGVALWPAMRRHLGLLALATALVGLVLVPVATSSGEQFRDRLGAQQLVRQHQHYAESLLPWSAALVVLLALIVIVDLARRLGPVVSAAPSAPSAPGMTRLDHAVGRLLPAPLRASTGLLRRAQPVLGLLTIAVAVGLTWYVYQTGDSGARAVWGGR